MMFLPRTVDVAQLEELSWMSCPPLDFEACYFRFSSQNSSISTELLRFKACLIFDHSRLKRTTCNTDAKGSLPILEDGEITEPIVNKIAPKFVWKRHMPEAEGGIKR
jgi:hypothetical protein